MLVPVLDGGVTAIVATIHEPNIYALRNKDVWSWGTDGNAARGNGSASGDPPTIINQDQDGGSLGQGQMIALAAAEDTGLMLESSGAIYCWGFEGVLCDAQGIGVSSPARLTGSPPNLVQLSARFDHACAYATDKTAYCWGNASDGALGIGATDAGSAWFTKLQNLPVRDVVAGYHFTIALHDDGTVWGWGLNASAQTGHTPSTAGDVSCETTGYCAFSPVQIPNFPP